MPDGAPAVLAELGAGPRTLLLYNHYDVQPPDPLDLWERRRSSRRSATASSMRGAWPTTGATCWPASRRSRPTRPTIGPLPLRLRWFIEGEEEIGSPHLASVTQDHADALQADWCAWEGGGLGRDGHAQRSSAA